MEEKVFDDVDQQPCFSSEASSFKYRSYRFRVHRSSIGLGRAQRKAAAATDPEEWMAIGDAGMRAAYFKRYQAGIRDTSLLRCDSSIRIDVEWTVWGLIHWHANMCRADKQNLCRRYNNWKKWADVFDLAELESLGRSGQMK